MVTLNEYINEYIDENGRSPLAEWFDTLEPRAAGKLTTAILRMEQGNFSNVSGICSGVYEHRIDYGPGYRGYLGNDGEKMIILLGGGTKKRQQKDIDKAKRCWENYTKRKQKER